MKSWLAVSAVVLSVGAGCGGESNSVFAGNWVSTSNAVMHTEQSRSVFGTIDVTITGAGAISGSWTTTSPTSVVGERGTVTGTVVTMGPASADVTLNVVFPTLGTFRASGPASYTARQLAIGSATTRDGAGAVVGSMTVVFQKQ